MSLLNIFLLSLLPKFIFTITNSLIIQSSSLVHPTVRCSPHAPTACDRSVPFSPIVCDRSVQCSPHAPNACDHSIPTALTAYDRLVPTASNRSVFFYSHVIIQNAIKRSLSLSKQERERWF